MEGNMELGKMLKQLRESKGLSQKKLGEELGVSDVMISLYEKKSKKPSTKNLIKLAEYFNVIVGKEQFAVVQERLAYNKINSQTFKAKETYVLSGIIYCRCGGRMNGSRRGDNYAHYVCTNKKQQKRCDSKTINKKTIEAFVMDQMEKELFSDEAIERLKKALIESGDKEDSFENQQASLNKNLSAIDAKINNIVSAISEGMFNISMKDKLTELEKQKIDILTLLNSQEKPQERDIGIIVDKLNIGKGIKEKPLDEQKVLARTFIEKVIVDGDMIYIDFLEL